ncbi:uncharacterized protein EDB93DRAFT_1208115 [Suillus bovinus]|uniref:uncharacterized protein n=1 Tax=Suillus bovinus TaxID=48563 RepID=UPI001B882BE9|nr:uncharacterized protein EDB93DRAFT_1208115 [Suillus bovinus]KAG2143776.1 hypothetical protein EDB93DRAFT_1208115 [Suillus bovinus]
MDTSVKIYSYIDSLKLYTHSESVSMSTIPFQAVPQDITIRAGHPPRYAFLAHPPPPKKRPTQPLPSPPSYAGAAAPCTPPRIRPRSNTFSTITAWAARVQPGSPASISPRSPRRRPSIGCGRRASITSARGSSGYFLNVSDTPSTAYRNAATPSIQNFKADLTSVGYTSAFLQFPKTPIAVQPRTAEAGYQITIPPVPVSPTRKSRGLTRLRSLSALKCHSRSKSAAPSSPTKMKAKAAASSAAVVKRKKAKYAHMRPAPLANELALMQFADGGSMESNIKRVMEAQARAGAAGVGDIHRDGQGGMWWDQEEEWEYRHLLAGGEDGAARGTGDLGWVTFGGDKSSSANPDVDENHRISVSSRDSDLDPRYIIQPTDHLDTDDLAVFGSAPAPLATRKPGMSVLALPSRPGRAAKHLRKPDYLLNEAFTIGSASPKSPQSTISACASGVAKPKGKARRRPTPLTLAPPSPALKQPSNSPVDAERTRKNFLESSFEPAFFPTPAAPIMYEDDRSKLPAQSNNGSLSLPSKKTLAKKPPRLNMIGLFKSSKK